MIGSFEADTLQFENLDGYSFKERFEASTEPVMLDVRTPGEFHSGTIPGAINIDIMSPAFREEVLKMDKKKEYFVICRSGARSGQACRWMVNEGFKVRNLHGGLFAWPE